jgi:hypothetical protein
MDDVGAGLYPELDDKTTLFLSLQCQSVLVGLVSSKDSLPCIRYVRSASGEVASAATMAMMLYHKECSESRDRIYGLAGLCNLDTSYQISYSKSTLTVQQVFVDFTLHCLGNTMSLDLFQTKCRIPAIRDRNSVMPTLQHRNWLHGLPSWCPDFAGPQSRVRDLIIYYHPRKSPLRACRGQPARFTALTRQCVAAIGVYVGSVKKCSCIWRGQNLGEEGEDFLSENKRIYASLQHCASSVKAVSPGQSLRKLVLDVCSAGVDFSQCPAWSYLSKTNSLPAGTQDRMAKRIIGAAWIMEYMPGLAPKGGLAPSRKVDADELDDATEDVNNWLFDESKGTRLFTTDNSAPPLGSGLDGTRVGDIVCVLFGSNVPLVLRQVGNKGDYKLIGECYVTGIMQGEALDMGLEEREFRLI